MLIVYIHPSEILKVISRGSPFTLVLYSASTNPSPNGLVAIASDTSVKFISSDGFAEVES